YDLLEESMVQTGRAVLSQHGLAEAPVDFQVGDAANCPLVSRFHAATSPSILWLNDEEWPRELRDHVKARAGRELSLGSVVVSYGPHQGPSVPGLELAGSLRAATSWCRAEEFHVWKRV
ncbi:dhx29, partial [Symbiodinium sp. CCMP2456]